MKTRYILSFSLLILLLPSCTKVLNDFEFEDKDPRIVVQARLTLDSTNKILITRSLDMYDRREVKELSKANVSLIADNGNRTSFVHDTGGWYTIPAGILSEGNTYDLEVASNGYPTAVSRFTVPALPEIGRIDTSTIKNVAGPWGGLQTRGRLNLHFSDNQATQDYYVVYLKKRFAQYEYDFMGEISDTSYFYNYIDISSTSPYVEAAYSSYTGYSSYKDELETFGTKLIISDELFNGKQDVSIDLLFYPVFEGYQKEGEIPEEYVDVYLKAVDKHFYEYARAKAEMISVEDNPLAEPVTPYSSVKNGYGLVYGESVSMTTVDITGLFKASDFYYGDFYYE